MDDDVRPVPVKSREQQNLLSLIRQRKQIIRANTQYSNRVRAWFYERGVAIAIGKKRVRSQLESALADNSYTALEHAQLRYSAICCIPPSIS